MKLRISISIEPEYDPQRRMTENVTGDLSLQEEFQLGALNFLEVCRILGQFDDLAKRVKKP